MVTDANLRSLDECVRATQRALADCARTKAIDPASGDVTDPAWCLAVEAECLLRFLRELRGKPAARTWFA